MHYLLINTHMIVPDAETHNILRSEKGSQGIWRFGVLERTDSARARHENKSASGK